MTKQEQRTAAGVVLALALFALWAHRRGAARQASAEIGPVSVVSWTPEHPDTEPWWLGI